MGTSASVFVCGILRLSTTPTPRTDDPAYWRKCAQDARRNADQVTDRSDKDTLFAIAEAYEQLAVLTEAKLAAKKQYGPA